MSIGLRPTGLLWSALAVLACGLDPVVDAETGGGEEALRPVLTGALDASACQEHDGVALAGAATFRWGEYHHDTSDWTGEERLYVRANDTWLANGGRDCEIHWTTTAVEDDPGACSTCDLGLAVTGTLAGTSCPEELSGQAVDFRQAYAVRLDEDGSARWFLTQSVQLVGVGYYTADAANFLGSAICRWFSTAAPGRRRRDAPSRKGALSRVLQGLTTGRRASPAG